MKLNWRIFYVLLIPCVSGNALSMFVRDYLLRQGIGQIVMFACWDLFERIDFVRNLMQLDIRILYLSIYSIDVDMKILLKVNYYKLGILLDLNCPSNEEIFQRFTSNHLPYNESYFWILTASTDVIPYEKLQQLPLSINTEMTLALQNKRNSSYTLYDLYNPSYRHGGKFNVTYIGYWSAENGLMIESTQYKYKKRGNLYGMYLNFSIVMDNLPKSIDPNTYLTIPINKHHDTMHRFNYALMRQLRDYYNFTINLTRGITWGYKVNGSFNGILGDMVKGIVDVSATPFRWKKERLDVLDYTVQTWQAGPLVIFRHPKKDSMNNQFFKPFSQEVWLLTAAVGFLNWFLLYLTVKVEQHYEKYHKHPIITLDTIPASETALIATAAICQQGLSEGPRLSSGRIVFLSLFFWALMLYQFYSASIVGSLLAESPRFITTPKALLESSLDLGVEDIAYNHDFFNTDLDPIVRELNRKKVLPNKNRKKASYFTPEDGLKKVKKGGFAFQVDVATAYKIIEDTFTEDEICDLHGIKLLYPATTWVGVAKHSPFKKMITYGMRQIVEKGLPNRLRHVWHHRRPQCPKSHSSLPTPVAIKEFIPALFMFMTGALAACFVMLIENLVLKYRSSIPN